MSLISILPWTVSPFFPKYGQNKYIQFWNLSIVSKSEDAKKNSFPEYYLRKYSKSLPVCPTFAKMLGLQGIVPRFPNPKLPQSPKVPQKLSLSRPKITECLLFSKLQKTPTTIIMDLLWIWTMDVIFFLNFSETASKECQKL